ncbi:MAG TPA: T9SS type A sorting domain-containing protein [Candidatus Kapabacteria bacterium]|jgi:hypothetical protein
MQLLSTIYRRPIGQALQLNHSTRRLPVLAAAAFILLFSFRAFGHPITLLSPDSITMAAAVGSSSEATIEVDDNDSTVGPPNTTIEISVLGSSEITLESDSIVQFQGRTIVYIRFAPTSSSTVSATVRIVGDSNTVDVMVVGTVLSHVPATLYVQGYDLTIGQEDCKGFIVSNPNADSIWVTSVELLNADQTGNVQWSVTNLPTLPFGIRGDGMDTLGQLCATIAAYDSGGYSGELRVVYDYGSGTDSTTTELSASVQQPNTACVGTAGGNFGPVASGSSLTQTITIVNVTDSAITLSSPQIEGTNADAFTINSPSFPVVVSPGDTASVSITFSLPADPTTLDYSAWFAANIAGSGPDGYGCSSLMVPLNGSWSIPVIDSVTLDAPPGTGSLSMSASSLGSRHAIFIQNMDTSALQLLSLEVAPEDTNIDVFFGSELYNHTDNIDDTLPLNGNIGPYLLTLIAPDTGTYALDFTLTYETQGTQGKHEITSIPQFTYHVVAHVLPAAAASVQTLAQPSVNFSLMPNPASDNVTVMLPEGTASSVAIYDVLGKLVWQSAGTEMVSCPTDGMPNGTYVVRVASKTASGAPVTSSKRLLIQK